MSAYIARDSFVHAAWLALILSFSINAVRAGEAVVGISDASVVEGDSGNRNLVFDLTRAGDTESNVTVNFVTAEAGSNPATEGTDYELVGGIARFLAGETQKTVSVPVSGDLRDELDETLELLTGNAAAYDPAGHFDTGTGFPVGDSPQELAIADLNGDGLLDIVTANHAESGSPSLNTLNILLSIGSNNFAPSPYGPLPVGQNPSAVAAGDFDDDNDIDLIAVNHFSDNVTVYLNDGAGAFVESPTSPLAVGRFPNSLALGDFNNDGNLDVAVASPNDNNATILAGDGSGGFSSMPGSPIYLGNHPSAVKAADVTGDGITDLVATNTGNHSVTVLIGQGDGHFTFAAGNPIQLPQGSNPHELETADLDGDSDLDIAVANTILVSGGGNEYYTSLLFNDGTGGFEELPQNRLFTGAYGVSAVTVGDITNDGKLDIVFSRTNYRGVLIFAGDGSGTFELTESSPLLVRSSSRGLDISDLTSDGLSDLVVANRDMSDVAIFAGNDAGDLTPLGNYPVPLGDFDVSNGDIAIQDINGDTIDDAVVALSNKVLLLAGDENGNFSPLPASPLSGEGPSRFDLIVGDINGDGFPDIVNASIVSDLISIWLGVGAGDFVPMAGSPYAVATSGSLHLKDFIGDPHRELFSLTSEDTSDSVTILQYQPGEGMVSVAGSPFAIADGASALAVGDVTGDLVPDIVSAHSDSMVRLYIGESPGGFHESANSPFPLSGTVLTAITLADVDGDSDLDVLAGYNKIHVLVNDGSGDFSELTIVSPPPGLVENLRTILVEDITGDDYADIVAGGVGAFRPEGVYIGINNTFGYFSDGQRVRNSVVSKFDLADLENDGGMDLVLLDPGVPPLLVRGLNSPDQTVTLADATGLGTIVDDDLMSVRGMSPLSGPAQGTLVTILGSNFSYNVAISFGGQPAAGVDLLSNTELIATTPALTPGSLNAVYADVLPNDTSTPDAPLLAGVYFADFTDVGQAHPFHDRIETLVRNEITGGCGGGLYCVNDALTRGQAAVFLLKSQEGSDYRPPACTGVFDDVPCPGHFFAGWIEELAARGITIGCGNGRFCPGDAVTRQQIAVFLLRTVEGSGYAPPACVTGQESFADVPASSAFCPWVTELAARGTTGGCEADPPLFCPHEAVTRGEVAAFLGRTFEFPRAP